MAYAPLEALAGPSQNTCSLRKVGASAWRTTTPLPGVFLMVRFSRVKLSAVTSMVSLPLAPFAVPSKSITVSAM